MITLYKKDSKGKIRIINFWCEGNLFHTEAGLLGGKLIKNTTNCVSKNIGKSNETKSREQAIFEMESKIREKLQEDYFRTKEEAENNIVILPMLAKSYEDEKKKIDWSKDKIYIQPKLDGQRCLAIIKDNKVKLISRDGVVIENMGHIEVSLSFIMEDCILDGELYSHGLTFQENMKLVKKLRPETSKLIKYHVYDCITPDNFTKRFNYLQMLVEGVENTILVSTMAITSEEEMIKYHGINMSSGYEGSIIRRDGSYKINGRSNNLLKFKDFQDLDAKIIDIIPAENRPEWGIVLCEYNGKQFKATPKMSQEDKIDLLKNKNEYIGKTCIITYFEFTDDNIPRFPIYKGIRLDNNK